MQDLWPTALTFLAFASCFLALTGLRKPPEDRRLRSRIDRVRGLSPDGAAQRDSHVATNVRRRQNRTVLGRIGKELGHLLPRSQRLRQQLDEAGIGLDIVDCLALCIAAAAVIGLTMRMVVGSSALLSLCIASCATFGLPHLILRSRIRQRRQDFVKQFPDAIDLVIRAVKSGLPVAEAMQTVADESSNQVGRVFQEVTGSIRLGKSLNEALAAVSDKVGIAEFRFFVISIAVQQETGGNLAEILQNLVGLMRRRSQIKLKIRAMSSEARASAMIIGALPFVMCGLLYAIDHEYITPLFTDPRGWLLLTAGLTSLGFGLAVMAKMVRFEI